jgi:hypothetical protein
MEHVFVCLSMSEKHKHEDSPVVIWTDNEDNRER